MASDPITSRHPSAAEIIARATCRADAAEALTLSATRLHTEQCDRWMKERQPIAAADTLRVWGTARECCRAACECVEMLFHSAGASGAKRGDRLQRYFAMCRCTESISNRRRSLRCCGRSCGWVSRCRCRFAPLPRRQRRAELPKFVRTISRSLMSSDLRVEFSRLGFVNVGALEVFLFCVGRCPEIIGEGILGIQSDGGG
jgi:hypothetical protein